MPARLVPGGRSTGTSRPVAVQVVLDEACPAARRRAARARRGTRARGPASGAPSGCSRPAGASARSAGRSPAVRRRCPGLFEKRRATSRGCTPGSSCRRPRITISSRPAPDGQRRDRARERRQLRQRQLDGRPGVQEDPVVRRAAGRSPRSARARRRLSRQAVSSRSTVGKPMTSPAAFASGVASRTSAMRDEPLVVRVLLRDDVEQVGVLGRRQPHAAEVLQPPAGRAAARSAGASPG